VWQHPRVDEPTAPPIEVFKRCARWRCPRCGIGPLFGSPRPPNRELGGGGLARLSWFRMQLRCGFCLMPFVRGSGYYLGAIYVNYGVTTVFVLLGVFVIPIWWPLPTSVEILIWSTFAVVFPLLLFRHARSFWLGFDYLVDPWQPGAEGKG
jgi:uncharacterized protein (DUF983 family)